MLPADSSLWYSATSDWTASALHATLQQRQALKHSANILVCTWRLKQTHFVSQKLRIFAYSKVVQNLKVKYGLKDVTVRMTSSKGLNSSYRTLWIRRQVFQRLYASDLKTTVLQATSLQIYTKFEVHKCKTWLCNLFS